MMASNKSRNRSYPRVSFLRVTCNNNRSSASRLRSECRAIVYASRARTITNSCWRSISGARGARRTALYSRRSWLLVPESISRIRLTTTCAWLSRYKLSLINLSSSISGGPSPRLSPPGRNPPPPRCSRPPRSPPRSPPGRAPPPPRFSRPPRFSPPRRSSVLFSSTSAIFGSFLPLLRSLPRRQARPFQSHARRGTQLQPRRPLADQIRDHSRSYDVCFFSPRRRNHARNPHVRAPRLLDANRLRAPRPPRQRRLPIHRVQVQNVLRRIPEIPHQPHQAHLQFLGLAQPLPLHRLPEHMKCSRLARLQRRQLLSRRAKHRPRALLCLPGRR